MVISLSTSLTETSPRNTYISRESIQQASIHHTQYSPSTFRKMPLKCLNALEKGYSGQITYLPAPSKLRAHKNQLANSIMDKNGGMMIEERTPILTQSLRLPNLPVAYLWL